MKLASLEVIKSIQEGLVRHDHMMKWFNDKKRFAKWEKLNNIPYWWV